MRKLLLLAALCASAFGQETTTLLFYDASSNLQYVCTARSVQPSAAVTITNVVDSGSVGTVNATAHGLAVGNQVIVSGSATAALNGTYTIATVPGADSFTITTSGLADTTYTDATVTTMAPRSTAAQWTVQRYTYDVSNRLTMTQTAVVAAGAAGAICGNRATLAYR